MTLMVVAFTVIGFVFRTQVGALSVPPTATASSALAGWSVALLEPQPARKSRGMTAADSARQRGGCPRGPLSVWWWVEPTITPRTVHVRDSPVSGASLTSLRSAARRER